MSRYLYELYRLIVHVRLFTYLYGLFRYPFVHRMHDEGCSFGKCRGEVVSDFNAMQKSNPDVFDEDRKKMVAERAYGKSEKRGSVGGHEMEDWLEAEWEIKNQYFYWFQEVE